MNEVITAIPVYNGERFLPATLECLRQQTRKPDRIVVFDNGSTDRTLEICRSYPDLKCEIRQNESNLGVLGNANRCLSLASETQILHLLMADDLVLPTFFEKLVPPLLALRGGDWAMSSTKKSMPMGMSSGREPTDRQALLGGSDSRSS